MKRGEIYAYPLCLQMAMVGGGQDHSFFAQDVVCQYRPWLERISTKFPEDATLQRLLLQKPFLSIMHACAHSWHCQVRLFICLLNE